MKPIIGITTESKHDPLNARSRGNIKLNWNYFQMVTEFGGVPIVIPPTTDLDTVIGLMDGWLIPGGLDLDAGHFFEANHPKVELQDASRWELESALYKAIPSSMPILGICYGCQFINVIQGGSLEQHVPDRVGHEGHSAGNLQDYHVIRDSKLGQITETAKISGKSYHHQAVAKTGKGVRVTARSEDETVEAIEVPERDWTVAVQWHPERTPNDEATHRLFSAFIGAAAAYRASK